MSQITDIKHKLEQFNKLLASDKNVTSTEAEFRAGQFLVAMALVTDWKHLFTEEKIKFTSVQAVVYAEELFKGVSKTVTENKLSAEASKAYLTAREELEGVENDISYLKTYLELYTNAHIFYRNLGSIS